ncbi:Galactosylgalactosylxylosylprotein 3-beta-glucuronosyltransferase 2 [Anabarilius grahami]|uniref:Galactosylgalactosylxylosylprotein 3-beta-glucuronosyltransferase n=1 Tax=Anabarilius grahami TaxID=495550 RepID=A0A3N0YTS6_ANAGA|nr:Galactosylgalactosylxylosylprotein 3-beta-glucuronosyltransferase 2 [Anabarilius grahami]
MIEMANQIKEGRLYYLQKTLERMRSTRRVSVWPVGLVGGRRYERPLVEKGKVVGWYTGWKADRPFAIDMAGFAVNLQVILSNPRALFKRRGAKPGMQESDFLKQITKVEDLEPKARNCTQLQASLVSEIHYFEQFWYYFENITSYAGLFFYQ